MYDRFTDRARTIMGLARSEAIKLGHDYIGTQHVFYAMLVEGSGVAASVLRKLEMTKERLRSALDAISPRSDHNKPIMGALPFTPRMKKVLETSIIEADALRHNYIGTEHLLLALAKVEDGPVAEMFKILDLNPDSVRKAVLAEIAPTASPTTAPTVQLDVVIGILGKHIAYFSEPQPFEQFLGEAISRPRRLALDALQRVASEISDLRFGKV